MCALTNSVQHGRAKRRRYPSTMPDSPKRRHRRRPGVDLDERFSLHPLTGEDVLERLLGTEGHEDEDQVPPEARDS